MSLYATGSHVSNWVIVINCSFFLFFFFFLSYLLFLFFFWVEKWRRGGGGGGLEGRRRGGGIGMSFAMHSFEPRVGVGTDILTTRCMQSSLCTCSCLLLHAV